MEDKSTLVRASFSLREKKVRRLRGSFIYWLDHATKYVLAERFGRQGR